MRKVEWSPWYYLLIVFTFETIHTTGVALLFYTVLPELDTVRAMMLTNAVLLMPGLLSTFKPKSKDPKKKYAVLAVDVIAVLLQFVGLILWPVFNSTWHDELDVPTGHFWYFTEGWTLPLSLFLTSFGWWETFVDEKSFNPVSKYLWRVKINMIEEGTR